MRVEALDSLPAPEWLELRLALWPEATSAEHQEEMAGQLAEPRRYGQKLARSDAGQALGLAEVSLRHDNVNGMESWPRTPRWKTRQARRSMPGLGFRERELVVHFIMALGSPPEQR